MNTASCKNTPLARIRSESAYPFFRKFIDFFTIAGYILSGALVLAAVAAFASGDRGSLIFLIEAAVLGLLIAMIREVSKMVADIADATIQAFSREQDRTNEETAPSFTEPASSPAIRADAISEHNTARPTCTPCDESKVPVVLVMTGLVLFFLVIMAEIFSALIQ